MSNLKERIAKLSANFIVSLDLDTLCRVLTNINRNHVFTLSQDDLEPLANMQNSDIPSEYKKIILEVYSTMCNNILLAKQANLIQQSANPKQPIIVLEAHTDLASISLVSNLHLTLLKIGYGLLLIEQPFNSSANDVHTNASQGYAAAANDAILVYEDICAMSRRDFMSYMQKNTALIQDIKAKLPYDHPDFQLQIAESIVTQQWSTHFLPMMKNAGYAAIPVDSRSTHITTEILGLLTLGLRDLGFALALYVHGTRDLGSIMMVGVYHGYGIQKLYKDIFPNALQPMFVGAASIAVGPDSLIMHIVQSSWLPKILIDYCRQYVNKCLIIDMGTKESMQPGMTELRKSLGLTTQDALDKQPVSLGLTWQYQVACDNNKSIHGISSPNHAQSARMDAQISLNI